MAHQIDRHGEHGGWDAVQVDLAQHWVPVYYILGDGSRFRPGMRDLRAGQALPASPT